MNSPLENGSSKSSPPGVLTGWHTSLLGGLLLGVAIGFAAGGASAAPLITGCCDSLTTGTWPGYLPFVDDVYGPGNVDDQAYAARTSYNSMYGGDGAPGLGEYLGVPGDGVDPEVVVVLSGTPDPFRITGADPNDTIDNVEAMVMASLADGGMPIVVAPPPVLDIPSCNPGPAGLTCAQIDAYIANIGVGYEDVAAFHDVPFIDLYTLLGEYLLYLEPYGENGGDGVHPNDEGDRVIAQAVLDELAPIVGSPCDDGVDNDGDFAIDLADSDCEDASDWSEGAAVLDCDDGIDNDADGAIDMDDFGCHSRGDFSERTAPNVIVCDDGIDNDGDGTIDFLGDAGCGHPMQMTESPKCNDGSDNDGDGLIDFDGGQWVWGACTGLPGGCPPEVSDPDGDGVANPDPQCGLASIDRENPGGMYCGLGFEVSLLLAPLMWWRRRRAARR